MHGNRDTQDELWEFEEYVLKYVPGSIHSLKESLLAELETKCLEVCRDIYSDREVGLVLEALIRNGDWRTAAAVSKKRETYTDALVQRANKKIREAVDGNQPFESVLFRLALQRVKLAHASAFCYMTDAARKEALLQSRDLALGVPSKYAPQAKIIHLDIDKAEIDKVIKTDVAVVGDCKQSLPAITRLLNKNVHREWRDSFEEYRQQEQEKVIEKDIHPTEGPLLMGEVTNVVTEATHNEAVLVNDVGQNQMISSRYFKFTKKLSIVTSGGFGTMGFGLPAAIGATFGAPDRTICCFFGDGGFQMNIQELGTIMEQQAPVKMILLNNNYLGNVRQWQDLMFGGRHSFTHMMNPHYAEIAKAYGIPYDVVIDRKDLQAKVEKMISTKGPYLLECAIKENEDIVPMTLPGKSVDEMQLELNY
jgi:hypothetical protein